MDEAREVDVSTLHYSTLQYTTLHYIALHAVSQFFRNLLRRRSKSMLTSSGISRVAAILAAGRAVSNVGGGTNAFVEATAKLSMLLPVYLRLSLVRPPRRLAADGA